MCVCVLGGLARQTCGRSSFIVIKLARDHNVFTPLDNLADDTEEHTSGSWLRFKKHYTIKSAHLSNLSGRNTSAAQSDGISERERIRFQKNPWQSLLHSSCYYFPTLSRDWKRKVYVSTGDKTPGNNG